MLVTEILETVSERDQNFRLGANDNSEKVLSEKALRRESKAVLLLE